MKVKHVLFMQNVISYFFVNFEVNFFVIFTHSLLISKQSLLARIVDTS